ncbi:MAG: hypothetical protein PHR32_05650 [Candidatus Cloacimonetes bacterium]|nr:hypothetical protein [Candidatus Cloacimonadota bacterium]
MPRPLLPDHKGTVAQATPGQWLDFTQEFSTFQSNIVVSQQAKANVTSIPSPWARMLLFKEAIMDKNHILHMEVMSNILDVIELIFYEDMLTLTLTAKEIHISDEPTNNKLRKVLYDLHPENLADISITLIIASRGSETFVVAGTSQYTMFFTPLDLKVQNKFMRYFKDVPVPLSERPSDFQIYINKILIPNLSEDGRYSGMVNAFNLSNGICKGSDQGLADNSKYGVSDLSHQCGLSSILKRYTINDISSCNLLRPSKAGIRSPLVIDESSGLKGKSYYNNYLFNGDYTFSTLRIMDRKSLPGEDVVYPWVLPKHDFLEPVIIKYKYKMNDKFLVLGENTDVYEYALPLKKEFFDYFDPEDVDKYLTIREMGANQVRVKLEIPVQNGKVIEVTRDYLGHYTKSTDENVILDYDSSDSNTPLPHIVIWPNLSPEDWKDPYYGFVYGKRYGDTVNTEQISLEFLDDNLENVKFGQSRKTRALEIFRFENLPTYVSLRHIESGSQAFLILDHKLLNKHKPTVNDAVVGMDFGTSHTNIAIKYNNKTSILKYSSNFKGKNLNDKDFITLIQFSDKQVGADQIPDLIKSNLEQYFMPNCLSEISDAQSVNFPLPTMVATEKNASAEALLRTSINFSKYKYVPYALPASQINKEMQVMTDLKWNHELNTQNAAKEYLKVLLSLVKYELIRNGVNLASVKYIWAYPKAFSEVDIVKYKTMWNKLLQNQNVESTDESKAALLYFDYKKDLNMFAPSMSIVIDVGGGSSDISVWSDGNVHLLYSSLWAGRNLVGVPTGDNADGSHSVIYSALKNGFPAIAQKYSNLEDYQTHLNFMLSSISDADLAQHMQTREFFKVRFLIIYFFSSLLFEIGLQSKRFLTGINKIDICLAGNGSRFACWSCGDPGKIAELEAEIYRKVIRQAMLIDETVQINFIPSREQKNEVAIGLCEGDNDLLIQSADEEPYVAESLSLKGKDVDFDTLIKEFDEMIKDNGNTINIDMKGSEILRFHSVLFNILKGTNLYMQDLKHDPKLADLNRITQTIIRDWDNLIGSVRNEVIDNKSKLNSISSSIFILGMQGIIDRLHNYLSQAN